MADKPIFKVGYLKITDHLILGVSEERAKQNIENFDTFQLELIPYMGWNQISDAMKSGEIDISFMLAPTAMDLYLSGVKMKMILLAHKTGSVFIRNKKANITSVADLKGKIVAIPFQLSIHNMLLHKLLTDNGLIIGAGKDVQVEVMAPSQMPQAIQYDDDGEFAGYIVAEPFGSQAVMEGYGEEFYLSKDLWPKHPCCVVVAKDALIQQYPEAVGDLTKSLVNSGKYISENVDAATKIGVDFLGQSEAIVKNVLTNPPDRILTNELMPVVADLAIIQDYMHDNMKLLSGKIDLDTFVDTQFAKAAGAV